MMAVRRCQQSIGASRIPRRSSEGHFGQAVVAVITQVEVALIAVVIPPADG
jgi:hypothetical protein